MALDLFDRYGRLRLEFLEHPFKKGSGIWRDELSSGDLLLLDECTVNEAYRRQGLATKLVEAVIQACRARSNGFFALVHPGALSAEANMQTTRLHEQVNIDSAAEIEAFNDLIRSINTTLEVTSTRFSRSVGFRRVGSSSWFALAGNASHPAHTLPVEKDFELPDVAQRGTLATLLVQSGTQNAQATNRDTFLTRMSRFLDGLSIHDAPWHSTNGKGETVLHLAARGQDASAIAWILERNPRLSECRNLERETPLDALLARLERSRTHREQMCVSDQFMGHSLRAVECLAMLQNIEPTQAQSLRMRYGCTCAHCICGYLSPRMQFVLKYFADDVHHSLVDTDTWPHWRITAKFVPESMKYRVIQQGELQGMIAALYQRFAALCKSGNSSTMLPSAAKLLETTAFNHEDGRALARAVGSAVFWSAVKRGPIIGDGLFDEYNDNEDGGMDGVYNGLPRCRNDLEYGFVGSMLGYARCSKYMVEQ